MIKVTVYELKTKKISGVSKKTGEDYSFCVQEAYIHLVDAETGNVRPHPQRIEFMLDNENKAYSPGDYVLAPESIQLSREGRLVINPVLKRLQNKATTTA